MVMLPATSTVAVLFRPVTLVWLKMFVFLDREGAAVTQVDLKSFGSDEGVAADVEEALETGGGGGIAIEYAVAGHIEVFSGLGVHQEGESVVIHEVVPG